MVIGKNSKTFDVVCISLAFAGGLFAGWIDFNQTEVQPTVLLLIVFGAVLGFARPYRAWRWAIILGLCIPLGYLIFSALGYKPAELPQPGVYASLIALIPAFIGTYGGALISKALASPGPDQNKQ